MQWNQIKTLFILCFLILNAYLLFQLYEQQKKQDFVNEPIESTFEEQLAEDNITIPETVLHAEERKESFITVEQKVFEQEEIEILDNLKNQAPSIIDRTLIVSVLKEKISIPKNAPPETVLELIKKFTPFIEHYVFWKWDEESNIIMLFQQKNNQSIYYNQNGLLLLFLNEDNEVVFYSQSMLGEEEETAESHKLISPARSVETIYNSGELVYGDEINRVEVGFHTRIPSASGVQVFVPTWKVTVNETQSYFVNAIEGYVFASNDHQFLKDTLMDDLTKVQSSLSEEDMYRNKIINYYTEKLELIK